MILSGVYFILTACLFWGAVCRLTRTDLTTRLEVRMAFAGLGGAAVFGGVSGLLWWPPSPADVALAAAICGVPRQYDTAPSQLDEAPNA